jgi:hypothetical protein
MNEFDDPELRRSLGRLSGAYPDDVAAFSQVQGKVRQARRRRAVGMASSATLVAAFAMGAFALSGQRSAQRLQPADQSEVNDLDDPTTTALPTTVVSTVAPETSVDTTVPPSSTEPLVGDDGVADTGLDDSGLDDSGSTVGNGGTPTTARTNPKPPRTTVPATQPPSPPSSSGATSTSEPEDDDDDDDNGGGITPATQSFSGVGGSITVSVDSEGRLRMLSYTANAGYTADEIRNSGSRVGIRFRSGELSTRIRVEVVNGAMTPTIEEEG